MKLTLDDFKGKNQNFIIFAQDIRDCSCYEAIPESAIADIASEYHITNDKAIQMLADSIETEDSIYCNTKHAIFWVEYIAR